MNIGENIRRLRIENNMTQEKLARAVGVVPQSVSKWERGEGMPDISLLPALAAALSCSTDALLGVNEALPRKELDAIIIRANELFIGSDPVNFTAMDPDAAAEYLREQLRAHPKEWMLRYMLGVYITQASTADGAIRDAAKFNEALDVYESLFLQAPTIELRLMGAVGRVLCYCAAGDYIRAGEAAKELPSMSFTYDKFAPSFLFGEKLREAMRASLLENLIYVDSCIDYLSLGIRRDNDPGVDVSHCGSLEERLAMLELSAGIWEQLIGREWASVCKVRVVRALRSCAELCAEAGKSELALDYIERALTYCRPVSGEAPGYYAIRDKETYAGKTEDIIPSREAAYMLRHLLEDVLHLSSDADPFAPLRTHPRFMAMTEELSKYTDGELFTKLPEPEVTIAKGLRTNDD